MFVGAFAAGLLPGVVELNESKIKLCNLLGAGFMIGTALAVIIPEGGQAYFSAYANKEKEAAPPGVFGLALVGGFLLMLVLDSINFTGSSTGRHVYDFEQSEITQEMKEKVDRPLHLMPGFTTLVGILVHSSADGVALGAAAFAESADVGTLIALAIVLHKAPTAFGLSSFLLKSGWSWNQTRKGVFLFAAAAPLVATVGYLVFGGMPFFTAPESVAFCLLVSGGTFLYAACIHILPEALRAETEKGLSQNQHHQLTTVQVVAISSAAVVPLLFSLFHTHGHGGAEHGEGAAHVHAHAHAHV